MNKTAGQKFREALQSESPLQIVGVINPYVAIMAKKVGYKALYLSGAGISNSYLGVPDIGLMTLNDVIDNIMRTVDSVDTPLLADIDTGWGSWQMIQRAIKSIERAGAAAIHIEDQLFEKRCGHLPGKQLVSKEEMVDRIKAAVDAKNDPDFIIMARTDAFAIEGLKETIERAIAYEEAGADMLFPEALTQLEHYAAFKKALKIPLLANITEFGETPLFNLSELASIGVDSALYPLSVNRAMNFSAWELLNELRSKGTQKQMLDKMQTRHDLMDFLNYSL